MGLKRTYSVPPKNKVDSCHKGRVSALTTLLPNSDIVLPKRFFDELTANMHHPQFEKSPFDLKSRGFHGQSKRVLDFILVNRLRLCLLTLGIWFSIYQDSIGFSNPPPKNHTLHVSIWPFSATDSVPQEKTTEFPQCKSSSSWPVLVWTRIRLVLFSMISWFAKDLLLQICMRVLYLFQSFIYFNLGCCKASNSMFAIHMWSRLWSLSRAQVYITLRLWIKPKETKRIEHLLVGNPFANTQPPSKEIKTFKRTGIIRATVNAKATTGMTNTATARVGASATTAVVYSSSNKQNHEHNQEWRSNAHKHANKKTKNNKLTAWTLLLNRCVHSGLACQRENAGFMTSSSTVHVLTQKKTQPEFVTSRSKKIWTLLDWGLNQASLRICRMRVYAAQQCPSHLLQYAFEKKTICSI